MPPNRRQSLSDATQEALLEPDQDPFAHASVKFLASRFGTPLLIIDLARVRAQYKTLCAALPGVDLHYALKPLPHESVVAALRDIGGFFDLATNGEVELVRNLGIDAARCIHTHPIKRDIDIRNALAFGVRVFVVDNPDELRKFVKYRNRCTLLIRVSFRSVDAVCDLSRKFGCGPQDVPGLLAMAAQLDLKIAGLSFHVGSQAVNPDKFVEAIEVCRELIGAGNERGQDLKVLDIGGGFPVGYDDRPRDIDAFCAPIRRALAALNPTVRVIAEPGRFIAAPSAVNVAAIMGRAQRDGRWWYYLDDGLYGSYSGQLFDHAKYPIEALVEPGPVFPSVLAGPTCDSVDVIDENIDLPKLEIGALIVGKVMGAYTWASASEFNFFPKATILALDGGTWQRRWRAP